VVVLDPGGELAVADAAEGGSTSAAGLSGLGTKDERTHSSIKSAGTRVGSQASCRRRRRRQTGGPRRVSDEQLDDKRREQGRTDVGIARPGRAVLDGCLDALADLAGDLVVQGAHVLAELDLVLVAEDLGKLNERLAVDADHVLGAARERRASEREEEGRGSERG